MKVEMPKQVISTKRKVLQPLPSFGAQTVFRVESLVTYHIGILALQILVLVSKVFELLSNCCMISVKQTICFMLIDLILQQRTLCL